MSSPVENASVSTPLVVCPACHRPQFGTGACIVCGGALPEGSTVSQTSSKPVGREALLEAYAPYLEADLGGGRQLLLSERRVELKEVEGQKGTQLDLAQVQSVSLAVRPIWESLLFLPLFLGLFAVPVTGLRVLATILVVLSVAACWLQRRFALVWSRTSAEPQRWVLGFGRPGSDAVRRIHSVWSTLSEELGRRGISVTGKPS